MLGNLSALFNRGPRLKAGLFILVVLDPTEKDYPVETSTIRILADHWRKLGCRVRFVYGNECSDPADLVINHVDRTVLPDFYREYFSRYPLVLNGRVMDLSRELYSGDLVLPGDAWRGPVMVKTKANYGGLPEARIRWIEENGHCPGLNRRDIPLGPEEATAHLYPVYASLQEVPAVVWEDPSRLVQKCLSERDTEGNYVLRAWSFLGKRSLHVLVSAPQQVVKGAGITRRKILKEEPPEELQKIRHRLQIDYGRMDYALVEGRVLLYDVNKTTSTSARAKKRYASALKNLALGLADYVPGG